MAVSTVRSNFNYAGGRGYVAGGQSAMGNAFRSQMPPFMPAQGGQPFSNGQAQSPGGFLGPAQSPGGYQAGPPPAPRQGSPLSQALGGQFEGGNLAGGGRFTLGRQQGPPAWMQQYDQKATQQQKQADEADWISTVQSLGPDPGAGSPAYADYQRRFNEAYRRFAGRQGGQLSDNYTAWA